VEDDKTQAVVPDEDTDSSMIETKEQKSKEKS